MNQKNWPKRLWQYQTKPKHLFDYTLWFLLRPLMLWKAHGKISHWWHWRKVDLIKGLEGTKLPGDPEAFPRNNTFDRVRMSLGGWKKVYLVSPKNKTKEWFFAFYDSKEKRLERCSIILEGPIRLLTGPHDFYIYGLDKNNQEVPLKVHLQTFRDDPKHQQVPIV